MSNREALRRLSSKYPSTPEIDSIMEDLRKGSDLHIAIVASAIVEATLERLLVRKFKSRSPNLIGALFKNRGPLTDFHSKILIAEAFGVITSPLAQELHSIKSIRNTFAHAKVPISFQHPLVVQEVNSLKMLSAMKNAGVGDIKLDLENKAWFLLVTKIVLIIFDTISDHSGSAHEAISGALKD